MRIVKYKDYYYIQQSVKTYIKSTGINNVIHDATLVKFENSIYKGPHNFNTLDEVKTKLLEIQNGLQVTFIPNKKHSLLPSILI